jgi:hypothetical protein
LSVWTSPITWVNGAVTASQMNSLRDNLNHLKGIFTVITAATESDVAGSTLLRGQRGATTDSALQALVTGDSVPRLNILAGGTLQWSTGAAAADYVLQRGNVDSVIAMHLTSVTSPGRFLVQALSADTSDEVGIYADANEAVRAVLSIGSGTRPLVHFIRADGNVFFESDAAFRIMARSPGESARLGVEGAAGADSHSLFTWVAGDTQPRASLGLTSGGVPRLALGPGGSTAPDTFMTRSAPGQFFMDGTSMRSEGATSTSGAFLVRIAGDVTDRLGILAGGVIQFQEQTDFTAPVSNHARMYARDNGAGKTQVVVRFPTGAIQVVATEP